MDKAVLLVIIFGIFSLIIPTNPSYWKMNLDITQGNYLVAFLNCRQGNELYMERHKYTTIVYSLNEILKYSLKSKSVETAVIY